MGNCASSDNPIPHANAMRVLGALIICLSVCEFGVGGAVYGYLTNVHLGAWWAGICTFVAGVLGCFSNNKPVVIAACVFSILGCIVGVVGAIVDGISAGVFAYEKGCINTDTLEGWGSSSGKEDSAICAYGYTFYYNNFYNNYNHNFYYFSNSQCVCSDNSVCYGYTLANGNNCGNILTYYTNMLCASTAIVSILTVMTFVFSILTCIGACSNGYNSTNAPPPSVQSVQMASPQAAPYAIQPGAQMQPTPVVYGSIPQGGEAYPAYASTYPGQPVVYAALPDPAGQPQRLSVVYTQPSDEKAMLGIVPDNL